MGREITREFRRKFGPPKPLLKRDVLSKEEIIRLLKVAELREKAIICAMASGDFRLSACLGLQLKHFRDDIFNIDLPCYAVEIPESLNKEGSILRLRARSLQPKGGSVPYRTGGLKTCGADYSARLAWICVRFQ
ncbi:MAG: hypothetical protein QXS10_01440 [Candidatus Bathyarchaeia archaeon]